MGETRANERNVWGPVLSCAGRGRGRGQGSFGQRVVREGLPEEAIFEHRPEGGEGRSHAEICRKGIRASQEVGTAHAIP